MAKISFNIQCEMEERWINQFMSFLKYMEFCGEIGHSAEIAFYADGDGDFRPHFNTKISFNEEKPALLKKDLTQIPERLYDAG